MEETELLLPREKMLRHGVTLLKDDELLALFLRTGTPGKTVFTLAKELIEHFGSLYGLLTAELEAFTHVEGIGVAKYASCGALRSWPGDFTTCVWRKKTRSSPPI